jgi:hypothetical protein
MVTESSSAVALNDLTYGQECRFAEHAREGGAHSCFSRWASEDAALYCRRKHVSREHYARLRRVLLGFTMIPLGPRLVPGPELSLYGVHTVRA